MLYPALKLAHLLSIIAWVGGMAFAHFFLRPAVQALEPPQRLTLMRDVLQRFLAAMALAVAVVLLSGLALIGLAHMAGAQALAMPPAWTFMAILGLVMVAIFVGIWLRLFPRLNQAVNARQWPHAAAALAPIRHWVGVNLTLGVVIVAVVMLW